ncbi:TBC1 domain family member 5 homolog A-like [Leptopilina heterotoma]|uniref:TBC1 domain family member 5 homolog A-like n=1 Tax=Leptopilina heterotoma TaxID=63436 RepID=UPI001CA8B969|nr:TBC1 domain family member 5 homolog A-like [Leptopilina heterotoma]
MISVYEVMLREDRIERWKSEGYNFEVRNHKNNVRDQCYTNQYQNNYNIRQDGHRIKESDYDRDFNYFNYIKPQINYENRYMHQDAKNQRNVYELDASNTYGQPSNPQRRRGNQRKRQRFDRRHHGHNEFNNQNRNTNFDEHCQNIDMTSEGYGRENFYNRDQNLQEYNIESRNLQHRFIEEEESFFLRDECRRYNNIQDDYGREEHREYRCTNYDKSYMNCEKPHFVNDNFETNDFIETRSKSKKTYDHDFIIPPIIFKDSTRNQNLLKDKKQLDHNESHSVTEPHLQTEDEKSSDEKVNHNPEEPSEKEQTALYMNLIIDTTEENISINKKLPDNKVVDRIRDCIIKVDLMKVKNQNYFLDNKMFEGGKKNKEETSENTDSKRSKSAKELEKRNQLKNYTYPHKETSY